MKIAFLAMSAVLLTLVGVSDASAQGLAGRASVIDGDTIELRGQRVRLWGIDAPEGGQTCQDAQGRDYRCGTVAANALAEFIGAGNISCDSRYLDDWDRVVSVCVRMQDDVELNAWLVRNGFALDYPHFSDGAYARVEDDARQEGLGVWAGRIEAPWEWRRRQR